MQEYTKRLGDAPLGRLLIKLSLPGVAASISTSLYNVVNTLWVIRIGYEAIAALTIVMPFQILFYAIGGGTGIGISALVSRRFGEKNPEVANHAAGQMFFLSAVWGLLFMLVATLLSDKILPLLGATPDILDFSRQYLVITSYGAPLIIFALVIASLLRGSGDAVKPMIIMISSTVLNIILDPLLIFGVGPFPEMGVAGAALGTVIAQAFGALLGLYYLLAGKTAYHIKLAHLLPDMSILRDIYRVGASAMILQITESLSFILFNKVVSSFGSIYIAALGLAMRVYDLAFMPIMGLSNGLLPIVGFNFGSNDYKRLWRSVKLATSSIMLLLFVITIFIEIFTPQIISIFSKEAELVAAATPVIRIMLSTLVLVGPTILFITAFQGMSRGTLSLILSLVRQFFFFIPLLYLFSYLFGITGVWISLPASDVLGFTISFLFILREYKKQKNNPVKGYDVMNGSSHGMGSLKILGDEYVDLKHD